MFIPILYSLAASAFSFIASTGWQSIISGSIDYFEALFCAVITFFVAFVLYTKGKDDAIEELEEIEYQKELEAKREAERKKNDYPHVPLKL